MTLSAASGRRVRVSARTSNGTASSSSDYTLTHVRLSFAAGDTRKTISVRTTSDTRDESNETFYVRLSSATDATISDSRATGTIIDNDDPGSERRDAYEPRPRCGSSRRDWTFYGHLTRHDTDYFKIVCDDARGTLRAYTTGSTDTFGRFRFGDDSNANADNNDGSGVNFDVSQNGVIGTYYLEVLGTGTRPTGPYVLTIQWRPYDASDSWGSAETISVPASLPRYFSSSSDTDWFKFNIRGSRCSTVTIKSELESRLSGISAFTRTDPRMHLYLGSGSGSLITDDDDSGTGLHFNTQVLLRHGRTFYIKVTNLSSHAGPYTLKVTHVYHGSRFYCLSARPLL